MSQNSDIRDYLLVAGNSLTPLEALQRFECISLGQRIYDLKKLGWQFSEEWERHGKKKVKRFKMIGDVAVDATPVAIDTPANTCAIEAEKWADYEKAIDDALLIPARFLSARKIKKLSRPDSDASEETEPEEISTRPYAGLTQRRLL